MAKAIMQCGAAFPSNQIYGPEDGFPLDTKTGRLRVIVYDLTHVIGRPKTPDGHPAECMACKCRRASGRKERRGFPMDKDGNAIMTRPVPMVTCLIASWEL